MTLSLTHSLQDVCSFLRVEVQLLLHLETQMSDFMENFLASNTSNSPGAGSIDPKCALHQQCQDLMSFLKGAAPIDHVTDVVGHTVESESILEPSRVWSLAPSSDEQVSLNKKAWLVC